jgi:hypothetical protein
MRYARVLLMTGGLCLGAIAGAALAGQDDFAVLERQFRELPMEARRLLGPLFFLHGDDTPERLKMYVAKVAEGGNGCFTAESRPHPDWLGPGWFRDLAICLEAAKKHNLKMWIFDEKWFPSQVIDGKTPPRYAGKRLEAAGVDVEGPRAFEAADYCGERYIAAVAGRLTPDGRIDGDSLVDLAPHVRAGKLSWPVPAGKWKIMKFSYRPEATFVRVDGASKDCVDWFLQTVYQPHYEHFKVDFGRTIAGFFYDEPETRGDWGTELNRVLDEQKVDWKKAYVAYKFTLAGEDHLAAQYGYLDAFAEAWGRTMYGGMTRWCHAHGVRSIGHFQDHNGAYLDREMNAGDLMRLQSHSDMGAIDLICRQLIMGKRTDVEHPIPGWEFAVLAPKLASSGSHVYGKRDDVSMVELFGARGQDLGYPEMKWWSDSVQVSGINFLIPHSFNVRAPYDTDCPPFFYNGGYEPRWPLYRVYADYTSRLSLMLTGGRHVCPVALLFGGNATRLGNFRLTEGMTMALQDVGFDCDWLPLSAFERNAALCGREIKLQGERYRALIVPPLELIPYATLLKAKQFFDQGGVVIGYGFLPSKSATIGRTAADIAGLCRALWGDGVKPGTTACKTNAAGGRSYFLPEKVKPEDITAALRSDAGVHPTLEVVAGQTDGWLHVLHRQKSGRDIFLVCNQNHQGAARQFTFRMTARGEPECWDPVRNEITAIKFHRIDESTVEVPLSMEPLETVLLVFQPRKGARPGRIDPDTQPVGKPIVLTREANPPAPKLPPLDRSRPKTVSPVAAADPFRAHFTLSADVEPVKCRVYLEMEGLPDDSAAVRINGVCVGGVIGRPSRLDIGHHVKPGSNLVLIEPLAPKRAKIVVYR